MPLPGAGDDGVKDRVLGFPAEFPANLFVTGDQDGRITRPAGEDLCGNGMAR